MITTVVEQLWFVGVPLVALAAFVAVKRLPRVKGPLCPSCRRSRLRVTEVGEDAAVTYYRCPRCGLTCDSRLVSGRQPTKAAY